MATTNQKERHTVKHKKALSPQTQNLMEISDMVSAGCVDRQWFFLISSPQELFKNNNISTESRTDLRLQNADSWSSSRDIQKIRLKNGWDHTVRRKCYSRNDGTLILDNRTKTGTQRAQTCISALLNPCTYQLCSSFFWHTFFQDFPQSLILLWGSRRKNGPLEKRPSWKYLPNLNCLQCKSTLEKSFMTVWWQILWGLSIYVWFYIIYFKDFWACCWSVFQVKQRMLKAVNTRRTQRQKHTPDDQLLHHWRQMSICRKAYKGKTSHFLASRRNVVTI